MADSGVQLLTQGGTPRQLENPLLDDKVYTIIGGVVRGLLWTV